MKRANAFVVYSALLLCVAPVSAHPIESTIAMLEKLSAQVQEEHRGEEVLFAKYDHWAQNSLKTLQKAIAVGKEQKSVLESKIEAESKKSATLKEQIANLQAQIGQLEAADQTAAAARSKEGALYEETKQNLEATIAAVGEALAGLQSAETSTQQSLASVHRQVQTALARVPKSIVAQHQSSFAGFLQEEPAAARPDLKAEGDQAAHVDQYAFKSAKVVELLKQLKAKFEADLLATEKGETNAQNAHALAASARADEIQAATATASERTTALGASQAAKTEAEGNLQTTESDLADDSALFQSTQAAYAVKKQEWEERTAARAKEQEAIAMAVKILGKVTGVRTKAPTNPVPPPPPAAAASFLQEAATPAVTRQERAVKLLRLAARKAHSQALEQLAREIVAKPAGPFDEVIQAIQKMIFRLQAEQTDEDNHKAWCDKELAKTAESISNKDEKLQAVQASIAEAEATVQLLAEEIAAADEAVAEIDAFVAEATEVRQTGAKENAASIKDAQDAQTALANAVAVLEAYYKETGMVAKEAWEFVQRGVELSTEPATWESSYTGVADPTNQPAGIIAILNRVAAGFASMEADTRAQESTDSKAYKEQMKQSAVDKAQRSQESKMKSDQKKRLEEKLGSMGKTAALVNHELQAVKQYSTDLQPACADADDGYTARKDARATELQALRDAQKILEDVGNAPVEPSAGFLQPRRRI